MLAFQTVNVKRPREDDSDDDGERYLKKTRPWPSQALHNGYANYPSPSRLPFRPSLTPSPPRMVPNLEAMTPAQSEHSGGDSPASVNEDPITFSSPLRDMDMDMDVDEDDFDVISSQPPDSPFIATNFLRPAKLNSDLFVPNSPLHSTGRMPTPIYPNFQSGGMNGLGYPSSGLAGGISMSNGPLWSPSSSPMVIQQPPPSRKQGKQAPVEPDRSRRMPSPISEDEDIPDTPTAATQSQLSRLSVTSHATPGHMDIEKRTAPSSGVPPTPTRGRKRSGAFTGMGRFSMGYRDDCEKCRQRVPGHYSHFLP